MAKVPAELKIPVASTTGRTEGAFTPATGSPLRLPSALKLVKNIGEGHSGQVLLATSPSGDEFVMKSARKDSPRNVLAKLSGEFAKEQRVSARVHDANKAFVQVLASGELQMGHHRYPTLIMERVPGAPLADVVTGTTPRKPVVALRLVERVAAIASDLEKAGLRHNDLHTENIFSVGDDPGTVRIIDLGRVSSLTEETKRSRIVYAAPERRAGGGTKGIASDVYTVGVVLFTLLSGHSPAPSGEQGVPAKAISAAVRGLETSAAQRDAILGILTKALATKPKDRFESFEQFRNALADALRATASERRES